MRRPPEDDGGLDDGRAAAATAGCHDWIIQAGLSGPEARFFDLGVLSFVLFGRCVIDRLGH